MDSYSTATGGPDAWSISITPPPVPSAMPPGKYMLFFVAAGRVSVGVPVTLQ
jgi:hypothetical protein